MEAWEKLKDLAGSITRQGSIYGSFVLSMEHDAADHDAAVAIQCHYRRSLQLWKVFLLNAKKMNDVEGEMAAMPGTIAGKSGWYIDARDEEDVFYCNSIDVWTVVCGPLSLPEWRKAVVGGEDYGACGNDHQASEPSNLVCPLTHLMFRDPVFVVEFGNTYEHSALIRFWDTSTRQNQKPRDPYTNCEISDTAAVYTNWSMRRDVQEYLSTQGGDYIPYGWPDREMPRVPKTAQRNYNSSVCQKVSNNNSVW